MSYRDVVFDVTATPGISGYWLALGNKDVPLTNGKGRVRAEAGKTVMLVWWMVGNPGASITIEVRTAQSVPIIKIKDDPVTIPPVSNQGAGFVLLEVPA